MPDPEQPVSKNTTGGGAVSARCVEEPASVSCEGAMVPVAGEESPCTARRSCGHSDLVDYADLKGIAIDFPEVMGSSWQQAGVRVTSGACLVHHSQ